MNDGPLDKLGKISLTTRFQYVLTMVLGWVSDSGILRKGKGSRTVGLKEITPRGIIKPHRARIRLLSPTVRAMRVFERSLNSTVRAICRSMACVAASSTAVPSLAHVRSRSFKIYEGSNAWTWRVREGTCECPRVKRTIKAPTHGPTIRVCKRTGRRDLASAPSTADIGAAGYLSQVV